MAACAGCCIAADPEDGAGWGSCSLKCRFWVGPTRYAERSLVWHRLVVCQAAVQLDRRVTVGMLCGCLAWQTCLHLISTLSG